MANLSIIRHTHFVVFFSRSILANSFGEWILENMYVLPIEMQGARKTFAKECIGPVPADETLTIDFPNESFAAFLAVETNAGGLV